MDPAEGVSLDDLLVKVRRQAIIIGRLGTELHAILIVLLQKKVCSRSTKCGVPSGGWTLPPRLRARGRLPPWRRISRRWTPSSMPAAPTLPPDRLQGALP